MAALVSVCFSHHLILRAPGRTTTVNHSTISAEIKSARSSLNEILQNFPFGADPIFQRSVLARASGDPKFVRALLDLLLNFQVISHPENGELASFDLLHAPVVWRRCLKLIGLSPPQSSESPGSKIWQKANPIKPLISAGLFVCENDRGGRRCVGA